MPPIPTPTPEVTETNEQENTFGIDNFLLTALENPRDRLTILKLDQELELFVKDPSRVRLDFPPTSSYQRLIIHRIAQYFKLEHAVLDVEGGKRAIVLSKTDESRIPILRFVDLIEQPEGPPAKSVKIMRRGLSDLKKAYSSSAGLRSTNKSFTNSGKDRTLEEREEEYAKARARIFGNGELQRNSLEEAGSVQKIPSRVLEVPEKDGVGINHPPYTMMNYPTPIGDSGEYHASLDGKNWNRLWNPGTSTTQPMDSLYNYEYYDPNFFNYPKENAYPNGWKPAETDFNDYTNYLAPPVQKQNPPQQQQNV